MRGIFYVIGLAIVILIVFFSLNRGKADSASTEGGGFATSPPGFDWFW